MNKMSLTVGLLAVLIWIPWVARAVEPQWIDYGCNLVWEVNGCTCNGLACQCQERARYEHKGWSFGGELDLPLTVSVACDCAVFVFWWIGCDDSDVQSGEGDVTAEANCYFTTGASTCDDTQFTRSCY